MLLGPKPVTLKEQHDLSKLVETADTKLPSVAMISTNAAKSKEFFQTAQYFQIALVLNNTELRNYLESDPDRRIFLNTDEKAAFPINETAYPIRSKVHVVRNVQRGCDNGVAQMRKARDTSIAGSSFN